MRSQSGRRSHVSREHLFVSLKCPRKECVSTFFTMEKFGEHIKVVLIFFLILN